MDKLVVPEVDFNRIRLSAECGDDFDGADSLLLLKYGIASEARKVVNDVVTNYDYSLQAAETMLLKLGITMKEINYKSFYCTLNRRSNGIFQSQSNLSDISSALEHALAAQPQANPGFLASGQVQPRLSSTFSSLRKSNLKHPDAFAIHCLDLPVNVLEAIAATAGVSGNVLDECEAIWKRIGSILYAYKACYLNLQNLDEERHVHHMVLRCTEELLTKITESNQNSNNNLAASIYPTSHLLSTTLNCANGFTSFSGVPDVLVEILGNASDCAAINARKGELDTAELKVKKNKERLDKLKEDLVIAEKESGLLEVKCAEVRVCDEMVQVWEKFCLECIKTRNQAEINYRLQLHSTFRTFFELKFPAFRHGNHVSPGNGLGAGAKSQLCGQCIAQQDFIGGGYVTGVLSDGVTSAAILLLPHTAEQHEFVYFKRELCPRRSVLNLLLPILLPPQALFDAVKEYFQLDEGDIVQDDRGSDGDGADDKGAAGDSAKSNDGKGSNGNSPNGKGAYDHDACSNGANGNGTGDHGSCSNGANGNSTDDRVAGPTGDCYNAGQGALAGADKNVEEPHCSVVIMDTIKSAPCAKRKIIGKFFVLLFSSTSYCLLYIYKHIYLIL